MYPGFQFLIAIAMFSLAIAFVDDVSVDPDVGKDMVGIVTSRGIPYGKNTNGSNKSKPPVILQHGLLDCSFTWVNNFEQQSLGFILADAGFDVWFGNNRGNRYGRNHTSLDPDDGTSAFWSFSWDEMGLIDVPTIVNYVLTSTGKNTVGWVGHSEGTTQIFSAATMTSSYPVLENVISKINIFIALAPVAYAGNQISKTLRLLAERETAHKLLKAGVYEYSPWYEEVNENAPVWCKNTPYVCELVVTAICGPSFKNLNASRMQVYFGQTPAGTSMQNMDHWAQGCLSHEFTAYDYGNEVTNMAHYNSATPLVYNISNIYPALKIALFSGGHDYLADTADVAQLTAALPTDSVIYSNIQPDYAHADFVWGVNAHLLIYPKIVELLTTYAN